MTMITAMNRRSFLKTSGLGLAMLPLGMSALSGCGPSSDTDNDLVTMGIIPGTQALWRYAESEMGEKSEGPFQTKFISYTDESTQRNQFLSGRLDVFAANIPSLPAYAEQIDEPCQMIVPLAWLWQGISFFAKKDSGISRLEDLRGERIAVYPMAHPGFAYWRSAYVERTGRLIEDDFKLVETSRPDIQVDTGEVVAGLVAGWSWLERRKTGKYKLIATLRDWWKEILGHDGYLITGGGAAKTSWVEKNMEFVRLYRSVLSRGLNLVHSDLNAFATIATDGGGVDAPSLSEEQTKYLTQYDGLSSVPPSRVAFTSQDVEDNFVVYRGLAKSGYIEKPLTKEQVASMFLLKA